MDIDDEVIGKWPNVAIEAGTDLKLAMPDGKRSVFDEPEEPEATPARFAEARKVILNGESYELDTRERLEADLKTHMYEFGGYCFNSREGHVDNVDTFFDDFIELLDRQDAITRREFDGECEFCQSEVARLQQRVDNLTADAKRWADAANEQRLVAMEQADKVCELTAERDKLKGRLENQAAYIAGVEDELCRYESQVVRDGKDIDKLTAECDSLGNNLNSATEMLSEMQRECNKLTAERDELKEQLQRANKSLSAMGIIRLNKQIAELTEERDHCANCYDMAVKRGQGLLSKIAELTAEVEAQRKRANDAERGVLSEVWYVSRDRYEDDIAELTAERDKWRARAEQVQESYLDAKDSRDNLQAAIDAMENGQFYAMYRQACLERDDLRERLDAMKAVLDKWTKLTAGIELPDYPITEFQPKDKDRRIAELTAERDELRAQLDTTRDVAREFRDERDELKHANSLLQSTIAELGVKVDEKQAELLEARASCKADPVEIQLALARFADEWTTTDTRAQEQRLITYYAHQIANLVDNPGGVE